MPGAAGTGQQLSRGPGERPCSPQVRPCLCPSFHTPQDGGLNTLPTVFLVFAASFDQQLNQLFNHLLHFSLKKSLQRDVRSHRVKHSTGHRTRESRACSAGTSSEAGVGLLAKACCSSQ